MATTTTIKSPEAIAIISPGRPYRATKLWNQLVYSLRSRMPIRRHRYHMRFYDQCFTGRELVDWLHDYLMRNPNFGVDVTRQQARLVGSKLLFQDIIALVRVTSFSRHHDDDDGPFEDSGKLYKLTESQCNVVANAEKRRKKMERDATIDRSGPYNIQPPSMTNGYHNLTVDRALQDVSNCRMINANARYKIAESEVSRNTIQPPPRHVRSRSFSNSMDFSRGTMDRNGRQDSYDQRIIDEKVAGREDYAGVRHSRSHQLLPSQQYTYEDLEDVHLSKVLLQQIWLDAVVGRLCTILQVRSIASLVPDNLAINAEFIMKNAKRSMKAQTQSAPSDYYIGEIDADEIPYWARSVMKCLATWPEAKVMGEKRELPTHPGYHGELLSVVGNFFNDLPEPLLTYSLFDLFGRVLDFLSASKATAKEALQLALLLLTPKNRHHLRILLQFMSKADKNDYLSIGNDINSKREVILLTFSKSIFSSAVRMKHELHVSARLVAYLLDHHTEIFEIPSKLKIMVGKQIRAAKIKEREKPKELAYCNRISSDEYTNQTKSYTQDSIKDLLIHIMNDKTMDSKTKKARLKQFQKIYPEMFAPSYPDTKTTTITKKDISRTRHKSSHYWTTIPSHDV